MSVNFEGRLWSREDLLGRFRKVRRRTEELAAPLSPEDQTIQSMESASPVRWHLAHTTWFFDTFVLSMHDESWEGVDPSFRERFNSYYQGVGPSWPRARRGGLSRPTSEEVREYRRVVDEAMVSFLSRSTGSARWWAAVEIGLEHEGQHQELLLTDIKHGLWSQLGSPVYGELRRRSRPAKGGRRASWVGFQSGIYEVGHGGPGFAFDHEGPRHRVFLEDFEVASRPVTCGEYLEFMIDGGYDDPRWWLSQGWEVRQAEGWRGPLYWEDRGTDHGDAQWQVYTLRGWQEVNRAEPVAFVSFFEADAYARWAMARLPTEAEWEVAAATREVEGHFAEEDLFHPRPVGGAPGALHGLFGDVWEWTGSPYVAYPGFRPWTGVLGEYNGKFMCNQYVLRGGSCLTGREFLRPTTRNYFSPETRWQCAGFRLARTMS